MKCFYNKITLKQYVTNKKWGNADSWTIFERIKNLINAIAHKTCME